MSKPHDISDDEILDILGTAPPAAKRKSTPRSSPKEPAAPPETHVSRVAIDEHTVGHAKPPTVDELPRRSRSVVLVAIAVAIALALATVGIYVLIVYGTEIGAAAALPIFLVISAVGLTLGVIYVLSPLIVVFQINELNRRTAETNRLLHSLIAQRDDRARRP